MENLGLLSLRAGRPGTNMGIPDGSQGTAEQGRKSHRSTSQATQTHGESHRPNVSERSKTQGNTHCMIPLT